MDLKSQETVQASLLSILKRNGQGDVLLFLTFQDYMQNLTFNAVLMRFNYYPVNFDRVK